METNQKIVPPLWVVVASVLVTIAALTVLVIPRHTAPSHQASSVNLLSVADGPEETVLLAAHVFVGMLPSLR